MPMNRIATTVNQFHSGTGVGDAITNEMFTWRDHLRQLGYRSEIFGEHVHPALREDQTDHPHLGDPDALLIVHHSMGYDAFDDVLELRIARSSPITTSHPRRSSTMNTADGTCDSAIVSSAGSQHTQSQPSLSRRTTGVTSFARATGGHR